MQDLQARYTHVKSHYGKAKVEETATGYKLYSYGTFIASVDKDGSNLFINGQWSNTTMRHIKDFVNQYSKRFVTTNNDIRDIIKEGK